MVCFPHIRSGYCHWISWKNKILNSGEKGDRRDLMFQRQCRKYATIFGRINRKAQSTHPIGDVCRSKWGQLKSFDIKKNPHQFKTDEGFSICIGSTALSGALLIYSNITFL